jgi:DNA-binding MarR family transcriptional regulator
MRDLVDQLLKDWQNEEPKLDPTGLAVAGRIIRLGQQMQASANKALAPFGLSYTDFDLLASLTRSGAPYAMTPTRLRDAVLLSSSAMTAAVDRLEKRGLIVRRPSSEDRRSMLVCLTDEGHELVLEAAKVRFAEARTWSDRLDTDDLVDLIPLLKKLTVGT